MYDKYFGLNDKPFSIAPDPRFLFMSEQHREALAHLLYGVGDGGGFVLLTGEVGTGKTTVCRCLLEQLPENTRLAFILNPKLSAVELLATACDELKITYPENASLKQLTDSLNEFLLQSHAAGLKVILMIDEAQNLDADTLEQIRLLTNLETNKEKLLQIILIGQPELKDMLAKHELRQLAQRITARFHLNPLTLEETQSYITHRLEISGFNDTLFDQKAVEELYLRTSGIPRLINVLCDRSMLGAYAKNRRQIGPNVIKQAAAEVMGDSTNSVVVLDKNNYWRNMAIGLTLVLIAVLSYTLYLLSVGSGTYSESLVVPDPIAKSEPDPNSGSLVVPDPIVIKVFSKSAAIQKLMKLWGFDSNSEPSGICNKARVFNLMCQEEYGEWWQIKQLDRPVVLTLNSGQRDLEYVLLIALDSKNVQIDDGNEIRVVPRTELAQKWTGEYSYLWKTPPNYDAPLSISAQGLSVQWLLQNLAKLDNLDLIVPPNAVFDEAVQTKVETFQRRYSLVQDGVAGPRTLIMLNSILDESIPTLSRVMNNIAGVN